MVAGWWMCLGFRVCGLEWGGSACLRDLWLCVCCGILAIVGGFVLWGFVVGGGWCMLRRAISCV